MLHEKWLKVRGPKYVVHDKDRLKTYQRQLSDLFDVAKGALK
jgi:hypothetical protein